MSPEGLSLLILAAFGAVHLVAATILVRVWREG